jgi:hypothetical protein
VRRQLTQEARILLLLQAAFPNWVPAPRLADISLQYSSRIFALRRQGWKISNKIEICGGEKRGYFRLGPVPLPRSRELRASQQKVADPLIDRPDSLFDDERHRDDG